MEHVFSKEVIDEVLDYTFQLVKENRTLYYDSNPNVASAFLHNELNNVGLDTMLNLKHLSCYNVTLRIDNLQDKIDAVVCQSGDGSISGEDSADLLTKTKTFILETLNWAFDESNTEHSQRRQDLLRPHFSDLECKIVHDTIQLFFYRYGHLHHHSFPRMYHNSGHIAPFIAVWLRSRRWGLSSMATLYCREYLSILRRDLLSQL